MRGQIKHFQPGSLSKQRGVTLFFALIALLAISLAAVALIRSVDTSTMIAGNIAFKQVATASADTGVEAAMGWLTSVDAANKGSDVMYAPAHPFNNSNPSAGYYSNIDPALSLTDGTGIKWDNTDSVLVGTDANGNTTRYVIQRMCRVANTIAKDADCYSISKLDNDSSQAILLPQEVCIGSGCATTSSSLQIRITSRTTGPRNTVSYVQAFVY